MMRPHWILPTLLLPWAWLAAVASAAERAAEAAAPPTHRVYSHLLEPREHPDYQRRAVKPPSWETFGNQTQFITLRSLPSKDGQIVNYTQELDLYTREQKLGNVLWPDYGFLFAKNVGEVADEIERRKLFLFDIWGYVPGCAQAFRPAPETFALLEAKLGERWLGTDIGEQDGRYIGGYSGAMTPASDSRLQQYCNFQRFFERMGDDLGHKHAALVSLNFGHYLLKEGTYTLIGAETAQGLPNGQVYYAFIRGAGKQYGVPWFGNVSIFNRWGWKNYDAVGTEGYQFGPTKGTSLSLMRRLLYSHILYNSVAVGYESAWFSKGKLTPVGRVQQAAQEWVLKNGQPGTMHTPVALMLDFFAGWSFPRHLYTDKVYRVWGNRPYETGDYLTDAVLDLIYPGYQDSSYYHDESGFQVATPYGDIADCLLSDAPSWLLDRYPVVVVAGRLSGGPEIRDRLQSYLEHGGHLVIPESNLASLPGGLTAPATGGGQLTVLGGDFALEMKKDVEPSSLASRVDQPLAKPYTLRPEARATLDAIFRQQQLFSTEGGGLSLITCRKAPGQYTIGVSNNGWKALPLKLVSYCGPIESLEELPLDPSAHEALDYTPEGIDRTTIGASDATTIAGGDVRIFSVRVKESGVEELAHQAPPARPQKRALTLRHISSLKEEILARPTFFEHFDSVVVDWRYLYEREAAVLEQESHWLKRQGLRIYVDLSSGVNLYPTLRLVDNEASEYAASMAIIDNVLNKMLRLGSHDLILRLHQNPEILFSTKQTWDSFEKTLRTLADQAAEQQVTLYLRTGNLARTSELLDKVGAKNLLLAPSLAELSSDPPSDKEANLLRDKVGLWLVAAERRDLAGREWDEWAPLHTARQAETIRPWTAQAPEAPLVLDAVYGSPDEEYRDAIVLEAMARQ